jgi:hypothetical protein
MNILKGPTINIDGIVDCIIVFNFGLSLFYFSSREDDSAFFNIEKTLLNSERLKHELILE